MSYNKLRKKMLIEKELTFKFMVKEIERRRIKTRRVIYLETTFRS